MSDVLNLILIFSPLFLTPEYRETPTLNVFPKLSVALALNSEEDMLSVTFIPVLLASYSIVGNPYILKSNSNALSFPAISCKII